MDMVMCFGLVGFMKKFVVFLCIVVIIVLILFDVVRIIMGRFGFLC